MATPCICGKGHRDIRGCNGARTFATRTPAQLRQWGREGGKTQGVVKQQAILDRYRHLDRDAAILSAWREAKMIAKCARYRMRAREAGDASVLDGDPPVTVGDLLGESE